MALVLRNSRPVPLREYALEQTKESIAWLRDYITAIKNGRFHPFTPLERKAREATRNEAWYCILLLLALMFAIAGLFSWTFKPAGCLLLGAQPARC